jgi:DNA processing protein
MPGVLDLQRLGGRLEAPLQVHDDTLWYEGNLELLQMPRVSVVGTRNVSPEGISRAGRITALLVREGFCIVSGMARGVDRVAHEVALEMNGKTIAVMGTPIDECYPKEHEQLKREIGRRGLVLSQFQPGTPIHRSNFPRRNILMAALSSTTFVVEADISSGTKHQVKAAVQMRKPVAFLASLVDQNYPWVREALDSNYGVVIRHAKDAEMLLRQLNVNPCRLPMVQVDFDLFVKSVGNRLPNRGMPAHEPRRPKGIERQPGISVQPRRPEEEHVDRATVQPRTQQKSALWQRIYTRIQRFFRTAASITS